ncbi:T6SS immunity protein Tdi1 domain-containing protein [Aquimarina sp. 2201CG5-10]|uniref:T6SS immunity protein Tdi1 domain-containing protein n=1 Tax=Aquimarina callyspongiae TaxID=3098150 RepID=UPI002AB4FFD8|nr:T6SS immunity protein Tdi1 domain-containing protein [Aquimarina sp. 2201CG5-10]MDY8138104.1 DUF1851 domain-containing protein [Aquimarina sp. 2201CG5-10]
MGLFSLLFGGKTKAQSSGNLREIALNEFLGQYVPTNCIKASPETIEKYKNKVPDALIKLWKSNGFGKYNNGLIEIINPDDFNKTLWTWLGKEVANYVPIAINGFGDLFYYRKLTESDEDVCVIEPHYRDITTCAWSLDLFFNDYLCHKTTIEHLLREDLFYEAIGKYGELYKNEIFYFAPALGIGGSEELKNIKKGNAQIHLDILFQLY